MGLALGSPQDMASDPTRPGPECSICGHERRDEFDTAVATKKMSRAEVARQVGCDKSAVTRHFRNHVEPALAARSPRDMSRVVVDVQKEAAWLFREAKSAIAKAKDAGRKAKGKDRWQAIRAARAYHAEARHDLQLLADLLDLYPPKRQEHSGPDGEPIQHSVTAAAVVRVPSKESMEQWKQDADKAKKPAR